MKLLGNHVSRQSGAGKRKRMHTEASPVFASSNEAKQKKEVPLSHDIAALLIRIVFMASVFLVLFAFIFLSFRYNDVSMQPSLMPGDMATAYRLDKRYSANDVIVFSYKDKHTCGRVVAVAGDTVDINENGLMVNGSHQFEPRITKETSQVKDGVSFPLTVPEGSVFVLGDNRESAIDSRILGCLEIDRTEGKLIALFRRRGL